MNIKNKLKDSIITVLFSILSIMFLAPIIIIALNSFKSKLFISDDPFGFTTKAYFVGLVNYTDGIRKIHFFDSMKWSAFITIFSVLVIILCTSMTAWYITRVKSAFTSGLYYAFAFSMIVPFQMVMFSMVKMASRLSLDTPWGIIVIYLGFGAGLAVFMFCGFVKAIPIEIEEAAEMDGCGPLQAFFSIVFPILRPTAISVAILQAMWVWNDYLLPYLVLDKAFKTIPINIQYLQVGYGSIDMGAMMGMLILAMVPIIVFYLACQKYIIAGITSGAVKG